MTLTPEQIAEGRRFRAAIMRAAVGTERYNCDLCGDVVTPDNLSGWDDDAHVYCSGHEHPLAAPCSEKGAYRIIEAHGADAAPARPTPFPASYDELVWDDDGWSQPFITGGEWPEWLSKEAQWSPFYGAHVGIWDGEIDYDGELAIRVRRREPKRETVTAELWLQDDAHLVTIDLIDGKPDLSTLKIAEDAL